MATRKRRTKKEIALAAVIADGCNPELVKGARFDGVLGIPVIERPEKLMVPAGMVPFSKIDRVEEPKRFAVCEYEMDRDFADLLRSPEAYVKELRKFQAFITPDASSMPSSSSILIGPAISAEMRNRPNPKRSCASLDGKASPWAPGKAGSMNVQKGRPKSHIGKKESLQRKTTSMCNLERAVSSGHRTIG